MKEEYLDIILYYKHVNDNIKIFDKEFVKYNKDKVKIIYKKKYEIKEYLENFNNNYYPNNIITIKLKGFNNITDMSRMFCGCNLLLTLSGLSKWNTSNIIDMSEIFCGCKS